MEKLDGEETVKGLSLAPLLLLAVCGLYLFQCVLFWGYINDDAYITFRFSRFLASGQGPYFNPGEHVEGYTNPLLMILAAGVIRLWGSGAAPLFAKSVGVLCGVLTLLGAYRLTSALLPDQDTRNGPGPLLGVLAAGLAAAHPGFVVNSTSGLETLMFACLIAWGVWAMVREHDTGRWLASGVLFAAAVLTRPEGIYIFALSWVGALAAALCGGANPPLIRRMANLSPPGRGRAQNSPRPAVAGQGWVGIARHALFINGCIVALVFIGQIALRMRLYDGEWLPNTYFAKGGGFWKISAPEYITGALNPGFFGVAGLAVSVVAALTLVRRRSALLIILVPTAGGLTIPFLSGTDWMLGWRLLVPYLALASCVAATGWGLLYLKLVPHRYALLLLLLVPAQFALHTKNRNEFVEHVRVRAEGYRTGHMALARWLSEEEAQPGDTIALMDIGIIGYECFNQTIVDITGLTDRHIAKHPGGFLKKEYDVQYVLDRNPRFIVLALAQYGQPFTVPPPGTPFAVWSDNGKKLYAHPEFKRRFMKDADPAAPPKDWIEAVANGVGAVRVFPHAHPGLYYLLAVFEDATHRET